MSQRDKPRLSLKNNTAGVREREDANRTREAGNRDEVEGVVANKLTVFCNGDAGFIDWLDLCRFCCSLAYSCFVRATWLSSEEQECCGCCGEDRVVQRRLGAQCHCHRSCE